MRCLALTILALAAVQIAAPAKAQTYDPNYPFCLQIYDDMVHYTFECAYTSMPQCQASASGRNAQCVVNPYYPRSPANPPGTAPRKKRHPAPQ
jgi:uncharacterized protein DUF3551